jgi:hypothetical protein
MFRAALERRICDDQAAKGAEDDSILPVPMVLVVVSGIHLMISDCR